MPPEGTPGPGALSSPKMLRSAQRRRPAKGAAQSSDPHDAEQRPGTAFWTERGMMPGSRSRPEACPRGRRVPAGVAASRVQKGARNGVCSQRDVAKMNFRHPRGTVPGPATPTSGWATDPATPSSGWATGPATSGRGGRRLRASLRIGLVALVLIPLLSSSLGAPPVATGDDLSDALARQKALKSKIAAQKQKVAELNGLQADLRVVISSTSAKLDGINADLAQVKADVKQMTGRVNAVKAVYDDQVAQLADLDAQLAEIRAEEVAKAAQLAERKALLAEHIRAAYDSDRTSLLETILSADSFSDVLADVGYLIDIGDQDAALAARIVTDQQTLAALRETVSQTRYDTDQLRAETAAQKKVLDRSLADLKQARAKLKKLEAETAKQLALQRKAYRNLALSKTAAKAILAAEAKANAAIQRKINRLLAEQSNGGGIPSQYSGSFIWPLAGTVTQEFGCTGFPWEPPYGNCAHFHQGIDIAAPLGSRIHAAGAGKVIYAGPLSDGAWVVIIAHSQHLISLYGHVKTNIPVHAGQFVSQGQLIAYVGMTGHTTGPHLHWAVELDHTWVNPRLFL
jgi:murein DD-endopeptidase MepM/ murein hydrolase activator NlpD